MITIMDKVLTIGMVITAIITLWAVVTPNHLFIG
jgi:hypothetical protein